MVSTGPERDETILLQHPFQDWCKIFNLFNLLNICKQSLDHDRTHYLQ
jgi:hypothetical protein